MADDSVQQILAAAADKFRGVGGCMAVVKDGQVAGQHAWGFAHLDDATPFTAQTLVPICSITKHLLCGTLYRAEQDDASLAARLQSHLDSWLGPDLVRRQQDPKTRLTVAHLCDNQSGIRDYWATTVLCGAKPEDKFDMARHAPRLRGMLLQSLHFQPGTEYSYCNTNFYIVARLLEHATGQSFESLVSKYIFDPAGMATACLPAAQQPPPPCVGYEGDEKRGYIPAINGIEWAGDAGIVASLEDMVAYEKHLQTLWDEARSPDGANKNWYQAATEPHTFSDGNNTLAKYRMGLGHGKIQDKVRAFGHGGALRGFRLTRLHAPDEKLAVVALFNHEASSAEAADFVLQRVLGLPIETPQQSNGFTAEPADPAWVGDFLDRDTGLKINVELGEDPTKGKVKILYLCAAETIKLTSSSTAESKGMKVKIEGDVLTVHRIMDNRVLVGHRIKAPPLPGTVGAAATSGSDKIVGNYRCDELDSMLSITGSGAILYGVFRGFMGKGPAHLMKPLGDNVWSLACPRGIDCSPPGDWTLIFDEDKEGGKAKGFRIGCWLTRKVDYRRVE